MELTRLPFQKTQDSHARVLPRTPLASSETLEARDRERALLLLRLNRPSAQAEDARELIDAQNIAAVIKARRAVERALRLLHLRRCRLEAALHEATRSDEAGNTSASES